MSERAMIPTTYYAYNRICMEKIDSCLAYSRINAAKHFAAKKKISLKQWLEIYTTFEYKDYAKLYGRNVYFKHNGVTMFQYKVLKYQMHVVLRFNDTFETMPKIITKNNFIGFLKEMKDNGWDIVIEKYPSEIEKDR